MLKRNLILAMILIVLSSFPLFSNGSDLSLYETLEQMVTINEQLVERVEFLEQENEKLKADKTLLIASLEKSTETIKNLKIVVENSAEETKKLRETIKKISAQVDEGRNFSIGAGVSYPLGGSVMGMVRPNNFPVGAFINMNINKVTGAFVSLGIAYSF